jgi:hypothetical protein
MTEVLPVVSSSEENLNGASSETCQKEARHQSTGAVSAVGGTGRKTYCSECIGLRTTCHKK